MWAKLLKTEYLTALIGMASMALAPKIGIPAESLNTFFISISGIVATYIAGRSVVKAKGNG